MRKSRMIAIILSLVMIIASLPIPTLAEEQAAPEQTSAAADTVAAPQDMTEQPVAEAAADMVEAAADGSIEAGATVEFKNTGGTPQDVTLKSTYTYSLSYVIYYADDTIKSHSFCYDGTSQTITVPARGRALVTAESGASYSYTSAAITAASSAEPVYTHIGLLTGETRRFKNITDTPATLIFKRSESYFCDYVLYDAAGNHSNSGTMYSDESLSVPAGYTAEITSRYIRLEIGALNGVFTVEQTDGAALDIVYGRPNESYSITNMTNSTQMVNGVYGVEVLYNASGEVESSYQGDNHSIEIKPGYKAEAFLLRPYTFNYSPACLKIEKLDKPAATVISAETGDSYSIENTTDKAHLIYGSRNSIVAYALCDAGGGVSSQSASMQFSNGGDVLRYISVPAHYTLKLTAQTYSEIYAPNALFKVTKDEEPIFDERTYAHGDSYIYKNKTGEEKGLLYTSGNEGAHCAIYNAAGGCLKMDTVYNCGTYEGNNVLINVPAGGYAKISQNRGFKNNSKGGQNIRVYAPKGCFDISESETPVFRETYVKSGQKYSFKNTSSGASMVNYSGPYKLYDNLGKLAKEGDNWYYGYSDDNIYMVPAGYTLDIAPNGSSDYKVYSYYDDFAITHTSAADYTEFIADKSYKITNNGAADYTLPNYGAFDYILYGENNTFIGHDINADSSITIPVNGYALVTSHVTFAVNAADAISVTETDPIYKISRVAAKSTSVFKNTSSYNVNVYIDKMPSNDYQYDYLIYGDDGTISNYSARSNTGSLTIPAKCSLKITATGYQPGTDLHITYPLSFISETEGESEAYYREFLSPGESVKVKNIKTEDASVFITLADIYGIDRAADYVIYNANGTYASGKHDFNVNSEKEISIPAGAEATITALSDVEVHCVKDYFETSASQSPAYEYHSAGKGETLVITNNNVRSASALITSGKYDMTVYDGDGKVKSCSADNDGSSIKIEAFESVAVTPLLGPIDVMLIKGMTAEKRDNPALFKSVAQANKHMSFKNTYAESLDLNMYSYNNKYFTYKISDSGGSVIEQKTKVNAYNRSFNIPAGGSFDVDFLSGTMVVYGAYEMTNGDVPPTTTIGPDPTSTPKPTSTPPKATEPPGEKACEWIVPDEMEGNTYGSKDVLYDDEHITLALGGAKDDGATVGISRKIGIPSENFSFMGTDYNKGESYNVIGIQLCARYGPLTEEAQPEWYFDRDGGYSYIKITPKVSGTFSSLMLVPKNNKQGILAKYADGQTVTVVKNEDPEKHMLTPVSAYLEKGVEYVLYSAGTGDARFKAFTFTPASEPVPSQVPTATPTLPPTAEPTAPPTATPTLSPTAAPTAPPTPTAKPTEAPITLSGIRIKSQPSKTTVVEGTALDTSGLKVEAVYSDGKAEEITDYTLTGYDMNSVGQQTITVEYMGFTASFNITVAAKSMIGIAITQKPDKRAYTQGESLDTAGMIVTAMYNNGTSEEIKDYTVSGYDPNYVGNQTISVSYNGYSAAFSVTVSAKSEITGTVETPKLSINSFIGGKTVTLTCATDGASIYYTTDGSAPDENSTLYSEPITLTETAAIKAIAVKSGMNPSKTAGGKITVGKTADPTSSRASGRVEVGTVITLRSETSGSMIYYTTDGSEPTTESKRYSGGIAITDDVTIKAIAVKDGYKNSGIFEASYTVPKIEPGSAAISLGSVSGAAGDAISVPVYLFMEGESGITDYRFTLNYDASKFEYQSVTPAEGASASDLFTSASGGAVTVLYSGAAIESGEVCNINLKAIESDEDGEYPISIAKDSVKIETETEDKFNIEITDGAITLIGSVNSNLELKSDVMLTDSSGNDITDKSSVKGEVTANVTLENANEDAALEPTTVNIIMAVYDREGCLVNISVMDADLSDLNYVFTNTVDIPEGVEVGSIKLMVWNGLSDMTPMSAASTIL